MVEKNKIGDKEAYRQVRRGYHNKLEFAKKNYLNMKIEEYKGNGKKLFSLMYDIIGRVKEIGLPDDDTSEQDLAGKFCNFFVDKITNIRDRPTDNSILVEEKEREPGMLEFNQVSETLGAKDNMGKHSHKL